MTRMWMVIALVALAGGGAGAAALASGDDDEPDPREFTTRIDNPYLPLAAGSRWVYRETDPDGGDQRGVVTATRRTKVVDGVTTRVVRDVVTEDGRVVEDTFDWYAQDDDGNVWYFGEATKAYEDDGSVSTAGSWEAGADGAKPGIVMPADPRVGMRYRQEHAPGEAEDEARVLALDAQAQSPFGHFTRVLLTEDSTPLEPDISELKLYARGVGLVLALDASGGSSREELLSFQR
jgi:hypothetical protein